MKDLSSYKTKEKILGEYLKLAKVSGWNNDLFGEISGNLKISEDKLRVYFPDGSRDVAEFFIKSGDSKLEIFLNKKIKSKQNLTTVIQKAVFYRLNLDQKRKEVIKKLFIFFTNPKNNLLGMKLFYETIDLIWKCVGDKSLDSNFYSKRFILSQIYIASLLFWINDKSDGNKKTEEFLSARFKNIKRFGKIKGAFTRLSEGFIKIASNVRYSSFPFNRKDNV